MEIDIINKKENKALDRTEIKFDCIYTGEATPKILAVKSKLVSLLNTKKDLIVVDSLQPHYGEPKATGYAKIYGSRDSLVDIETEHVLAKNKEAEKAESEVVEETESESSQETEVVEEAETEVVEEENYDDSDGNVDEEFEESEDVDDSEESAEESKESEESE
jgi:small subunit ribosomal protein S24e